jgi:hypothetical protein
MSELLSTVLEPKDYFTGNFSKMFVKQKAPPVSERLLPYSFIVAIWRGWMSLEERNYISWECNDFQRNRDSEGVDRPLSRGHEREVVPSEDAYPLELDSGI